MPPEPLPWDRKDFFKERKHERSESLGSVARWRDSPHHAPRDFNRWASSDFRRPPGHGKQGGWHVFSDDSGHGYGSSRSGDKMVEDESFRSSFSRGDGRYGRNSRDNRGPPYSQRESKGYSWETRSGSPNMPGRPSRVNNEQRSQDDMLTYSSHQQSDFGSAWDQIQLKEQLDKMGGSTGLGAGQKCERENSLVSIDWKPLKWTRSGSMSSRGSGFSHSSSSKSMGPIDSNEAKVESQPKTATPVQSPSGEATNCVTSAAPLEETTSRKKPRLGWGEGLAKYEKKKVDVPDGSMNKDAAVCSVGNTEQAHSLSSSLPDKSPRVTAFSDCASPATPSSVACSSSPGVEEKSFCKAVNVENDTRNSCGSSGPMYQSHHEGFSFQLEKLDGNSIVNLDSSILELLQSDDPSSVDSSIPRPTALNKLLIWKGEISKVLEVTESEIDSLENELKALKSDSGGSCPRPATSSSLPVEEKDKSCKEQVTNLTTRLSPLQIHSSGDTDLQKMCVDNGDQVEFCGIVKDEDIDSPGTATSKFVESLPLVSSDMTNKTGGSEDRDPIQTTKGEETCLVPSRYAEKTDPSTCGNSSMLLDSEVVALDSGVVDKLCDPIFSANKIFASRASDIFSKLLPKEHISGVSVSSSWKNDSLIKEKFAKRKRRLRFMERVITLKFKAFQHLWKEDMSVLSMRKYRPKSHKKFELSLRATNNGHQKHRSSIRSRFSTPGSLSVVPTTEIINFTNKLLSDSQVKPYRNSLKMPALILDKEEKLATRFVSSNGLVEDPCAVEKERALMNPWTPEEKELFIQKLTTYGKDFRKIASFLDHKTTADCVEFYYKHHKSDCFVKTKKKPDMAKQGKSSANTYLISDGKKWNREMDAASLDILGAASAIAAHADGGTRNRQTYSRRLILGGYRNTNTSRGEDTTVERSCSLDTIGNERETAAADVLAGICGSMSSEAVSSCITSSIDPGESYLEWKCQKGDSVVRRPLTPDVMQNVDDETCSDESCGEMDPSDWTDEEKSRFIQAVSSYGKDFDMISRCIRSRSQQQCKVFFSKARKCLGLDLVHPGPGNGTSVGDDANGGGSDAEDACVLETGSGISSDKSGCNMNEDVPLSVTNMNDDEADPAETMKLQTSPPRPEENNVIGEVDHGDGKPLKSLASDAFQAVDKPKLVFDGDTGIMESNAMGGNATENKILVAESRPVGEGINSDPPNPECMVGEKLVGQISSDRFGKKLEGGDERSNRDPSGCCLPASAHNSCGNTSDVAADGSCSAPGLNPECPHQVSVELNSVQKPSVISLPHENAPATAVSVPQDSAVIECEKSLSQDRMSSTLDLREGSVGRDESRKHLSGLPVHANVEASQVLRGYPLQMVPKKETNGDVSCGNLSEVKPDRNINGHYMTQDGFLHFGNSKPQCSQVDCPPVPLKVEQPGDARTAHSWSSSDSEKPSRNGDVKLFGKILSNPSSSSKPNGSIHENEEEGAHNQKFSNKSSNLNLTGHHSADGSSPLLKFDCSSYLGLENVPSRSYGGFWEGNKVQAGYSSFSDSAILLAKYPAAFSNFPTSSSQMEQQPPQAVLKTSDRSMNGISVFRGEEINGSNGVADYPVFSRGQDGGNKVQPFTVDVKQQQQQRQDVFDIPKRNGFDAISSIQQQGRGSVGMNVVGRGGILVGGPCTVSDPVAAIRMHYAKTEQYGGQAGSIFRKEESWRGGKGDIGR